MVTLRLKPGTLTVAFHCIHARAFVTLTGKHYAKNVIIMPEFRIDVLPYYVLPRSFLSAVAAELLPW